MSQVLYFFRGFIGIIVLLLIAFLFSLNKKKISWVLVLKGMGLQFLFALIVLKTKPGEVFFQAINDIILKVLSFSDAGASFIFGNLVNDMSIGAIFGFKVLPTIIFFSSLISVLYFLGVMQKIVQIFAAVMQKVLGTSGAESLSCSANIFVGQTEAPLLVKPFVETMTNSELTTIMTGGFATVAGGVMAAYVGMLASTFPDIAGHLLSASIMNAPAAIYLSKVILPETDEPVTKGAVKVELPIEDANIVDAAANGAGQGLQLALNVGAMLLAFIALIAMINAPFIWLGPIIGIENLSLELIFGYLFWPIAWVIGVPAKDCLVIGALLGKRLVINEFVTYAELADMLQKGTVNLDGRSVMIVTYAMCGFANFSSVAIQIGGIGGMAPSRRSDLARYGFRALVAGTLATFMSATIAGMITSEAKLNVADNHSAKPALVEMVSEENQKEKGCFECFNCSDESAPAEETETPGEMEDTFSSGSIQQTADGVKKNSLSSLIHSPFLASVGYGNEVIKIPVIPR